MALQITKTIEGKTASYWDIDQLYFNDREKFSQIEMRGYDSKIRKDEAYTGAKTSIIALRFSFSGSDYPNTNQGNLIKVFENKVKQSSRYGGWANAVIVP